jgi:alkylation response protein AidB-like acyl-CoA dehydrogenase
VVAYVSRHLTEIEQYVLRPADFSLGEEQEVLRDVVRTFLAKHCSTERVRAAEPVGWDAELWAEIGELGLVAMGVPHTSGGDGAGLVELALVAEELGRAAAPVPLVDVVVAARLLARLGGDEAAEALGEILDGNVVSLAVAGHDASGRSLVPSGAVTRAVIGRRDDAVVLARRAGPPAHVPNLACAPLAWWDLSDAVVLAAGAPATAAFAQAELEWRLLTAAALIGAGESAKALAADYARERSAFGVPIGSFQAVAHPLADVATAIEGGRRLVRKTAWFADHEPEALGPLVAMAFVQASEAAEEAGSTAIRTQGGFGFTLESDVQLFFRRAKGWSLLGGDRAGHLQRIADTLLGPRGEPT